MAADKIQKAGFIAVAHGGQPWQDATVFESVALGVGGADWYNRAFVNLDGSALNSPTMEKAFATLRTVQKSIDKDAANRDWNLATAMVINGKAAMQFMGDWAKGEFTAAGKSPGKDYVCMPAPGTKGAFTFNIDSFILFEQKNADAKEAQRALASSIMERNSRRCSISIRARSRPTGMSMAKSTSVPRILLGVRVECKSKKLVPSWAHGMAMPASAQGAMFDVVTQFMNSNMTPKAAAEKMAAAGKSK